MLAPERPPGAVAEQLAGSLGPLYATLLAAAKETGRVRPNVTDTDVAMLTAGLAACGTYPPDLP